MSDERNPSAPETATRTPSSAPTPTKLTVRQALEPVNSAGKRGQVAVMIWNIHDKKGGVAGYRAVNTLPLALKAACTLLDEGADVSEVASSGGAKGIDAAELRRLCAARKADKLN